MRRLSLVLALAIGCNGAGGVDAAHVDAPLPAPRVELGTGTSSFVAIPDESAELELVAGPQGGWHVWVTARIWNLDVEGLRIAYEATPAGATSVVSLPTELELNARRVVREGDHWLRAGDFLQLDVTAPADVVGMELDVTVRVTDTAGRTAEHTRRALIVDRE